MEERSKVLDAGKRQRIKTKYKPKVIVEAETVRMMLMKDVNLKYTGPVTGKTYRFNGGGSVLDVDKRDADIMIKKSGNKNCCSGDIVENLYFNIVR